MPLSYCFFKEQLTKIEYILRPMLPVSLKYNNIELNTPLLLDSGSDYSVITNEIIEDYFCVDVNSLPKGRPTAGIGGNTDVAIIKIDVEFGWGDDKQNISIPFQVPINRQKDPRIPLIGRVPFFYDYRIDFRMGYTDDKKLGKYVIYPEDHKRNAKKFDSDYSIPVILKRNK